MLKLLFSVINVSIVHVDASISRESLEEEEEDAEEEVLLILLLE